MKTTFFKAGILAWVALLSVSCSSEDSTSSTTTTTTTATTNTWVKLTAINADGAVKPNYTIMMFDQPVTSNSALPPIKKEVTTDANGLAYFDLNTMVTSATPTTYYFEAFVETADGYVWKSISHPSFELSKGTMATSSIIVN